MLKSMSQKQYPTLMYKINFIWKDNKQKEPKSFANGSKKMLTHIQPMTHFYTPWKHHKTSGFLMFPGGIEV